MRQTGKTLFQVAIPAAALVVGLAIFHLAVPSEAGEQHRIAFVTSTTGTGDLSSWAEADGGTVGAEAGDSICRNLAAAALLENPENFVAWISTETDDAYCRMHGLSGKKVDQCGEAELPQSAGPWIRADGAVWAPAIEELTSGDYFLYTPLDRDENGLMIVTETLIFTATDRAGVRSNSNTTCADWTMSSPDGVSSGSSHRTVWGWTAGGSIPCHGQYRLACLESVAGPPLPEIPAPTRPAFVTSARGSGDLGSWPEADAGAVGIAAGDSICRNLASAAGLEGASHYLAWLSDSSTDAIDRLQFDGPWQRLDGVPIAESKDDLTDGFLSSSVTWTEQGSVLGNHAVWTGTGSDGLANGGNCLDWSSSSSEESGHYGAANGADRFWTSWTDLACSQSQIRLYCLVDQPFSIFTDGFESGDTSAWSASVP